MDLAPLTTAITVEELQQWIAARKERRLSPLQTAELEEFFRDHPEFTQMDAEDVAQAVGLQKLVRMHPGDMNNAERLAARNWLIRRYLTPGEMGSQELEVFELWMFTDPDLLEAVEEERVMKQALNDIAADKTG